MTRTAPLTVLFATPFLFAGLLVTALTPSDARAWKVESSVSDGCHEAIAVAAIEEAGWPDGRQPAPLDETGRRAANDVAFDLPSTARNDWALAAVLGVRHADFQGHEPSDLIAIAKEHGRASSQPQHCLRRPNDDGMEGNRSALTQCRAFIMDQVSRAIGPGDEIDLETREEFEVGLDFRGVVDLSVNRFAFRMGLAMHALQDGFAHTLRTPDGQRVVHVLNYTDYVDDPNYREAIDGHKHESYLDQCNDVADVRDQRFGEATLASTQLLSAVNDPTGGREGRLERAQAVVDEWLTFEEGCTLENDYCDNASLDAIPGGTCTAAGDVPPRAMLGWLAPILAVLAALGLRRRRPRAGLLVGLVGAALLAVSPAPAEAQVFQTEAQEEAPFTPGTFGLESRVAAAVDDGALAASLGVRFDVLHWLTLGADLEINPWWSTETFDTEWGTSNAYLTGIIRWGTLGRVEFRSTLHAGASMLMFDLVAAERGTVGPFVGGTILGIAYRASEHWTLIADPGGIFVSVPQTQGVPLVYQHHRFTVGVRWTP